MSAACIYELDAEGLPGSLWFDGVPSDLPRTTCPARDAKAPHSRFCAGVRPDRLAHNISA